MFLWKWNKNKDLNSFKSSFHTFLEMGDSDNSDDKVQFITQISVIYIWHTYLHMKFDKKEPTLKQCPTMAVAANSLNYIISM